MKNTFTQLKGGDRTMAFRNLSEIKPASEVAANGGDKPDFRGFLDVAAWVNTDAAGNSYLSIKVSDRIKLVPNTSKQNQAQ
jgi:uncharacterized protein (DUF736 family)